MRRWNKNSRTVLLVPDRPHPALGDQTALAGRQWKAAARFSGVWQCHEVVTVVDLALSKEAAYLVAHIDIRVLLRARMEHSRPPIHPAACTLLPSRRQTGLDASAPTETPTLHLGDHKTQDIGLDIKKSARFA